MRRFFTSLVAASALVLSGCYHATIDTGREPSPQTITKKWAHGFIFGLVPPSATESKDKCPNGVAKVETQLSFLNMLASGITYGLYSPMQIDVTCAK
jgi:hypothetical protein